MVGRKPASFISLIIDTNLFSASAFVIVTFSGGSIGIQ
jgi:hypothetical protein